MTKGIKCTCGHSWNKSDSSKKDMYVCHMCGKDNTMKDGGWLNKFEQGGMTLEQKGDNYGTKPNPNNVDVSMGPNYVGLGYNTKGRNYSPAWGGQFQSGGRLPIITNDPKDPRLKAYNDSLKLSQTFPRWGDWADLNNNLVRLNGKAPTVVNTKEGLRGVRKPVQPVVYKKPEREPIIVNDPKDPKLKAYQDSLNLYNKTKDIQNPKYYTDGDPSWYNWKGNRKDAERFMRRNNIDLDYEYYRTNKFPGKIQPIKTGDFGEGMVYPIYKKPTQPVEYKKLEEIKPTQPTPKGSKKYIVNEMEVSEEDFLGSGATTGGGKRVIYNTPNRGTQKVLRLDGTPETDPEKIRRALATANKDEMAMGGSLPGSVGFTYARVAGSAPSNGKYAKKTKASAQNGKEMKFYQEGLDFKPNSIAQDGGVIVDPMGQWAHPGEVTIIPATDITMEGVDYPVLGISDTGDQQMMYPGEDYDFDGEYVTEYPMMQEGGWLSKYQEKAPSDATRVAAPIKPLTKKEQEENARINKETQKNTEERNKQIIADRKSKRETKGDVNVPGSFNITEKLRLFPESVGGVGEIIDEYVNPGTVVGTLADSLGESIAARSPEGVAATLAMTAGAGALGFDPLGSAIKLSKTAGKYLTEKTALKNAYNMLPEGAFRGYSKLRNADKSYRVTGMDAARDFENTGVLRSYNTAPSIPIGNSNFMLPPRPTSFPSFQKGYADMNYAPKEGAVIFETGLPTYRRGDINPVTGNAIRGRHYAHRVIDPKTGKALSEIPGKDIKMFEGKPNWLKGYKEVPKKENGGWLNKYK